MAMSLDIGELNKRLGREKAKSGDITASLIWNDPSDLDLLAEIRTYDRCQNTGAMNESGFTISHLYRKAGGELDVVMNKDDKGKKFSLHPVENIFWNNPTPCTIRILVVNSGYRTDVKRWPAFKDPNRKIPFKVYLTRDGEVSDFSGSFTTEDHLVSCFKFKVGVFYIVFPASTTSSTFKDLCSKYKVTWQDGCGYYAVVRSAKIHNGKELLLQNYKTNKFIVGREAVLRATKWPDSELKKGAKDVPADHTLFVQSESCNRVIPPGTQVLFEVTAEEHAKHKVINPAALEAAQDMAKTGAAVASAGKDSKAKAAARADPKAKAKAKAKAEPKAKAKAGAKRAASPSAAAPAMKRAAGGGGLSGKSIVFTGTLTTPRAAATAAAKAAGASVLGAVSKTTSILVAGPGAGSKIAKAAALGVEVWDEEKFKQCAGL